jgi:phosphate transport system permease protein
MSNMPRSLHNIFAATKSGIMYSICVLLTAIILMLLLLVVGYLISIGSHYLSWHFFTQSPIPQGMAGAPGGMKNGLVGTAILVSLASGVGIPVGMLCGIYLAEYDSGSWMATPVRFIADVLAGVPSIVVGILGYELVVRPIGNYNGWAGAFALAFIMIPLIARTTEEMLRLVPVSYREASIALGATKARTILSVILPTATGSIVTGIMLAVARVAGETAPLLFTALGSSYLTIKPNQQFPSLTKQIFDYATGVDQDARNLAWAGILVLIGMIFVLNLAIRFATRVRK